MPEPAGRPVRAARGPRLRCAGWRQEALLRLLENNLEVAERPEDLVVYAAHAKVARDHESLAAIIAALRRLRDGQTLLVQSGKPIAVFATQARGPAVLMANGNLVGRWATPAQFYAHEARGLIAWGGLTAGAWQYIGAQGVIQGTSGRWARSASPRWRATRRCRPPRAATARRGATWSAWRAGPSHRAPTPCAPRLSSRVASSPRRATRCAPTTCASTRPWARSRWPWGWARPCWALSSTAPTR